MVSILSDPLSEFRKCSDVHPGFPSSTKFMVKFCDADEGFPKLQTKFVLNLRPQKYYSCQITALSNN